MARTSKRKEINIESLSKEKQYNVALYTRLSVENSGKQDGDSIQIQKNLLMDYLNKQHNMKLVRVYSDNGYTGTNFDRPEWKRMIEDAKKGKINCIIVKDLSRLGRNYIEVGDYLERIFPFLDIRLIALTDRYDSVNPKKDENGMLVPLKNIINAAYAKDISKKVSSVFQAKKEIGESTGGIIPYGYKKSPENKNRYVVDEKVAPIVKQIFLWKAEGNSNSNIAEQLNKMGIPSRSQYMYDQGIIKNKKVVFPLWQNCAISRMIKNRVYVGDMVQNTVKKTNEIKYKKLPESEWIIVEDMHESIVSKELFNSVQKLRRISNQDFNRNINRYENFTKTENILKGIIFCADCKKAITRITQTSGGKKYSNYAWVCSTHVKKGKTLCTRKKIKEEDLLLVLKNIIQKQMLELADIKKTIKDINNNPIIKQHMIENHKNMEDIKLKLNKLSMKLSNLYDDYEDKILTEDEFLYTKQKYSKDQKDLKEELTNIQNELESYDSLMTNDNKYFTVFDKYAKEDKLTRNIILNMIDRIDISDGPNIKVTFKFNDFLNNIYYNVDYNTTLIQQISKNENNDAETIREV